MKIHTTIQTTLLSLGASLALSISPFANAAGPLAPPGPPAPLFKTLQEVEPRTPISSLPFVINQPGSYYVISNLVGAAGQNGISINSDCVTIDMMGFELRGVAGSLSGFMLNANARVYIYNGCIRNWVQDGVNGTAAGAAAVLSRLRVANNARAGIAVGNDSDVDDCVATASGTRGIQVGSGSNVRRCLVAANVTGGIVAGDGSSVIGCNANDSGNAANPNAFGISVGGGCTVRDCTTRNNTGNGITASFGCNVVNNSCRDNLGNNIEVSQECLVSQNACDDDTANRGQSGIRVTGNNNRIDHNTATETVRGLWITSADNEVIGNTVLRNFTNYVIVAGNQLNILLGQIPETIPWSAHVELAGTLRSVGAANGITITTNDVTIDLKGHALIGVAGSLDGISVSGSRTNIVIRNGTLRSWASDGIQASSSYNSSFSDLRVSGNGANGLQGGNGAVIKCVTARGNGADGITTASGCVISDSSSSENRSDGIVASTGTTVSGCSAHNNSFVGISANDGSTVVNCTAYSNINGIVANDGSTVTACTAASNATNGIVAGFGATINGCTVRANRTGINAGNDCNVINNACDGNTAQGILCTGSDNRVDNNKVTDSTVAIRANPATDNFIVRNTATGTAAAYDIAAGNTSGQVLTPGLAFIATNPWANFAY